MRETLTFIESSDQPVHGDPPKGAVDRLRAVIELRERLLQEQVRHYMARVLELADGIQTHLDQSIVVQILEE
jgi:hypothetical protein